MSDEPLDAAAIVGAMFAGPAGPSAFFPALGSTLPATAALVAPHKSRRFIVLISFDSNHFFSLRKKFTFFVHLQKISVKISGVTVS